MTKSRGKKPKYSVVIPAFQEEYIIAKSLKRLEAYLIKEKLMDSTEVVVVTADPKDRTIEIVAGFADKFSLFQHIKPGSRVGKGRDVRSGILAARGQYIVFTDADLATPVRHIKPAFQVLEQEGDVVIGVRNLASIHKGFRKFVSLSANSISRLLIARDIADTQCGFKGFRKSAAKHIFKRQTVLGWAFDMEIIFIARKSNKNIIKMPVPDWRENKPEELQLAGDSNVKASIKTFLEVLKIRLNYIKGVYR